MRKVQVFFVGGWGVNRRCVQQLQEFKGLRMHLNFNNKTDIFLELYVLNFKRLHYLFFYRQVVTNICEPLWPVTENMFK